jgi:2-alkyl-3-oxoalkanoate reductase
MRNEDTIAQADDLILVTGAAVFIGSRVVAALLENGFQNLRCLVRPTSNLKRLNSIVGGNLATSHVEVMTGNLLSPDDCRRAARDAVVIYHLAAGTGSKSFPDAYMNSVVTTRNLLDAALAHKCLRRFVNLSSFCVYTNRGKPRGRVLDESCPVEEDAGSRAEAYCFAKVKQDELVFEYSKQHGIPFVLLRPGVVYGPGKKSITGRVGIDTFGFFLHCGGSNPIPFTYVDNCAGAIVRAGVKKGIDGQVFNIVDDDLPSSREFLRLYKKNVQSFRSVFVPRSVSYVFCWLWEIYAKWSEEQLPPIFTRREWAASWKQTRYSNHKLKSLVGWTPRVTTTEGLRRFFEGCREMGKNA